MHGDQLVLGPFHFALARQRMIATARQHERVLCQYVEIEIRIVGAHEVDAELDFATFHCLQTLRRRDIQDAKRTFGCASWKAARHHAGQEVERRRRQAGDGHRRRGCLRGAQREQ